MLREALAGPGLLQMGHPLAPLAASLGQRSAGVTSDCAYRLNMHEEHHSACVVTRNNRALLVWVPYGSAPGWDLPGGRKHSGEAACETAEREVCEETGFRVRAVKKITYNVFHCEIVSENACTNAVDEGFLKKKFVRRDELRDLQYRGGTWGDKRGFLRDALTPSAPQPGWPDSCGCKMCHGEGFSSSRQQCSVGKTTEVSEACACLRRSAPPGEVPSDA